jgi:hypothetical protein
MVFRFDSRDGRDCDILAFQESQGKVENAQLKKPLVKAAPKAKLNSTPFVWLRGLP